MELKRRGESTVALFDDLGVDAFFRGSLVVERSLVIVLGPRDGTGNLSVTPIALTHPSACKSSFGGQWYGSEGGLVVRGTLSDGDELAQVVLLATRLTSRTSTSLRRRDALNVSSIGGGVPKREGED